jgi:hypothetical protein
MEWTGIIDEIIKISIPATVRAVKRMIYLK